MQSLDFYQLPRTAQERFVGSIKGSGLPTPILRASGRTLEPALWAAVAVVSLVVLLVLVAIGFGNLASSMGREGVAFLAADTLLATTTVFGALRALARRLEHRTSPFPRGVYVFPVGLIDARTSNLGVYPIEDLSGVYGPDVRGLTLDFGGRTFSFPAGDASEIAAVKAELDRAGTAMTAAGAARDSIRPKALAPLDPLQGYANPLSSSHKLAPARVTWATFAWAIAAVVGLAMGSLLWAGRNVLSDNAMFAQASAANDTATYRAYLEHGARHVDEVRTQLLPRAELHDAEAVGTVRAIERFIQDHPEPGIAGAAGAARRSALLRELDVARTQGTLAPLDAFVSQHPDAGIDAELAGARHHVFQNALDAYAAEAPDRAAAAFVGRLLAWSEKHGPDVEVRFRVRRSKTMEKADRAAGQSRQWKGIVSLPSRYFDEKAEKPDVDALVTAISTRFAVIFPKELVSFKVGAPLPDPDGSLPARILGPTLFVDQTTTWAGAIQASLKPRGVFVGLELTFDGVLRIPDEASAIKTRGDGWYVPALAAAGAGTSPEEAIYGAIRAAAFEQFERRIVALFFARSK